MRWISIAVLIIVVDRSDAAEHPTYFVSPKGNDAWSGTLPDPAGDTSDGPFATLARARDAVRAFRKTVGRKDSPIRVIIRGGRYELAEPLVVTSDDSGTTASPTIFMASPNEQVVISGGRRLSGWQIGPAGVMTTPLAGGTGSRFRHVAVNGEWRDRPRLPRTGEYRIAGLAGADPKGKYNTPANRFEYAAAQLDPTWRNLRDVEVVVLHFWVDTHLGIASINADQRVVIFDRKSRRKFTDDHQSLPARFYVSNVFEALHEGEFYHDTSRGVLHYCPTVGDLIRGIALVVPRLNTLIEFRGNPAAGKFVENVEFRGVTLSDTTWNPPPMEAVDGQAASIVPGAVVAIGARDCGVVSCRITNVAGYGIDLRDGCRRFRILKNEVTQVGAGGVRLTGGGANAPEPSRTGEIAITDNRLHDLGRIWHSGVGVLLMHAFGCQVAHNEIHDLYYTGISVGWVWGYAPSISRENRIEFNHIYRVGKKLLSDMGGVYLLGPAPGTVVRNNLIHDIEAHGYGGWGIYTDEGSTGVMIENNVVYRTTHGGFHQHYGRDNVVRNNVFALARDEQIARSRNEPHKSFTFERNIVWYRTGKLFGHNWQGDGFELDRNIYWNATGAAVEFPGGSLERWRARGHDTHSLVADPMFRDPARDDFSLPPNSPALRLGFKSIDVSVVGPRK